MVKVFEAGRKHILAGNLHLARQAVHALPWRLYEAALMRCESKHKDYYYYLIRFVFDSFEAESAYCQKPRLTVNLARFERKLQRLSPPMVVAMDCGYLDLSQAELNFDK